VGKGVERYGLQFIEGANEASIELECFYRNQSEALGGLGAYQHLHNAIDWLWNVPRRFQAQQRGISYDPEVHDIYIWNEWTEEMQRAFAEEGWVTVTGSGASWKTTSAGVYGVSRWFCSPTDTVVVVVSTTLDGLRRRIWKEVTKFYRANPGGIGNLVQSRNCIQFIKGSDDAGVFGIAVEKGDVAKAIGKIIGFHARHMVVIVDEMQTVNDAIVDACVNLESGAEHFQFIGLGNARSHFDPHGRMCEPADGWSSISVDDFKWRTKRGVCIHLDGMDSPNVRAGYDKYPGLLKQRDIDSTIERYGENSPQFWEQRRGFWAPEGISRTILSETMLEKFRAFDKPIWIGAPTLASTLDPSFEGGDRCVQRFPKCGEIEVDSQRVTVVDPGEYEIIKVDVTSREPLHYQIARQVKDNCEKRGITPRMFAYDATGEGGGLGSVLAREWSPDILGVEFGGRPSERPVSEINPRPCREEYYNRRTELWFGVRVACMNGQLRGMDTETATEFCRQEHQMRGMLIFATPKSEMKVKTGVSPDLADPVCIAIELFRQRLGIMSGAGIVGKKQADTWEAWAKKMDVYSDDDRYLVGADAD